MLTDKDIAWINHLSDTDVIKILPFDPSCIDKFEKIKTKIQSSLGEDVTVLHRGASGLQISGQDEIDVYVPVPSASFNTFLASLSKIFGKPKSHYPMERARFKVPNDGKRVDVFLINEDHSGWLNSVKFENHLKSNKEALEQYRLLKESCDGLSQREYYRRKIEFINDILSKE